MIRIGIMGYGNLGRGIECAVKQNPDMELKAVFTRRAPENVKILTPGVPVSSAEEAVKRKDEMDVLILCGGSATDLPEQTKEYAKYVYKLGTLTLNDVARELEGYLRLQKSLETEGVAQAENVYFIQARQTDGWKKLSLLPFVLLNLDIGDSAN